MLFYAVFEGFEQFFRAVVFEQYGFVPELEVAAQRSDVLGLFVVVYHAFFDIVVGQRVFDAAQHIFRFGQFVLEVLYYVVSFAET